MHAAKPSRAAERRATRELERAAVAASLAPAPVEIVARLSATAEEVVIDETFGLTVGVPAFAAEDAAAALRAHLANPAPYGPVVRRVALLGFQGDALTHQELELTGRLSAVERTAPDADTLRCWAEVGAHAPLAKGMPIVKQAEVRPV